MFKFKLAAAVAASALAYAPMANANFAGKVWQNTAAAGDVSQVPSGESATFNVSALHGYVNVDTDPSAYTLSGFLSTFPGFSGFSNASAGFNPSAPLSTTPRAAGGPNNGDFFEFTGPVSLSPGVNTIPITHDDGAIVTLNGSTAFSHPGVTPIASDTFTFDNTSAATTADLDLRYGEAALGAAQLDVGLQAPSSVPEPGTLGIMGVMLACMGFVTRKKVNCFGARRQASFLPL